MSIRIITISREFGSAGRTIGKLLGEKLGIPCYDSEIIDKVAEKSGFEKDYILDKGEYVRQPLSGIFRNNYYYQASNEDVIWAIQSKIIREFAEEGPCIIVGRCADYLLKDRDDVLKVFICADKEFRINRINTVYSKASEAFYSRSDVPAEKRIKDKDKRRASYYQFYTDMKWGNATNYDISLNSGSLGIDACVDILYGICTQKK